MSVSGPEPFRTPSAPRDDVGGGAGSDTCPQCGHKDSVTGNWVISLENRVRRWFGKPPAALHGYECAHGTSYDWDGCSCTHPFHSR